mgnify:CR=1 FL=1
MGGDLFSQFEEPGHELESPEEATSQVSPELPLVRTGSGRRSAFDSDRLRASIERAQKEAGEVVSTLSDEVADIVRFTLSSRVGRSGGGVDAGGTGRFQGSASSPSSPTFGEVIHADEIGALVERALIEVGATGTARSYIVARDRRMRARELGLGGSRNEGASGQAARAGSAGGGMDAGREARAGGPKLPSVRGAEGAEPFQARRIVAALIEEAGLLPAQAEEVASSVQAALGGAAMGGAGLRVVSTGLVRELVNSQLLARGLGEAIRRHESVGIPRHDLVQLYHDATSASIDGTGEARPFESRTATTLLRRWVLDDGLPPAVAQAHRGGDLYIGGLGALHRVRVRSMPSSLLLKGKGHSVFAALERVGRLAGDSSAGLIIEDLEPLVKSLTGSAMVESFALTLGAIAQASDRRIDLSATGGAASGDALSEFLNAMSPSLAEGAALSRIFASLDAVAAAVRRGAGDAAEALLWSGHLVPVWARSGATWSGVDRAANERGAVAIGASVGINLPRLARRAGPWREDSFLSAASEALDQAVEALEAIGEFQTRARSFHGVAVSDRISHTLLPIGLLDALRILGDGIARADQGSRILGFLGEAAQRTGAARGLDARLGVGSPTSDAADAGRWFAECDAKQGGHGQPRLFSDLPRPEEDRPRTYRASVGELTAREDASRIRERAEALGTLLCTVPSGALVPDTVQRQGGPGEAARAADFMEVLARAPRAQLHSASDSPSRSTGGSSAGSPAGGSRGRRGGKKSAPSPENQGSSDSDALMENRARWPRLAAWARFAEIRAAATVPLTSITETTLF